MESCSYLVFIGDVLFGNRVLSCDALGLSISLCFASFYFSWHLALRVFASCTYAFGFFRRSFVVIVELFNLLWGWLLSFRYQLYVVSVFGAPLGLFLPFVW